MSIINFRKVKLLLPIMYVDGKWQMIKSNHCNYYLNDQIDDRIHNIEVKANWYIE